MSLLKSLINFQLLSHVARLKKKRSYYKKTSVLIGDGGNDVSMIQAADVGSSSSFPTIITIAKNSCIKEHLVFASKKLLYKSSHV